MTHIVLTTHEESPYPNLDDLKSLEWLATVWLRSARPNFDELVRSGAELSQTELRQYQLPLLCNWPCLYERWCLEEFQIILMIFRLPPDLSLTSPLSGLSDCRSAGRSALLCACICLSRISPPPNWATDFPIHLCSWLRLSITPLFLQPQCIEKFEFRKYFAHCYLLKRNWCVDGFCLVNSVCSALVCGHHSERSLDRNVCPAFWRGCLWQAVDAQLISSGRSGP